MMNHTDLVRTVWSTVAINVAIRCDTHNRIDMSAHVKVEHPAQNTVNVDLTVPHLTKLFAGEPGGQPRLLPRLNLSAAHLNTTDSQPLNLKLLAGRPPVHSSLGKFSHADKVRHLSDLLFYDADWSDWIPNLLQTDSLIKTSLQIAATADDMKRLRITDKVRGMDPASTINSLYMVVEPSSSEFRYACAPGAIHASFDISNDAFPVHSSQIMVPESVSKLAITRCRSAWKFANLLHLSALAINDGHQLHTFDISHHDPFLLQEQLIDAGLYLEAR